jgi:hypothetical protein
MVVPDDVQGKPVHTGTGVVHRLGASGMAQRCRHDYRERFGRYQPLTGDLVERLLRVDVLPERCARCFPDAVERFVVPVSVQDLAVLPKAHAVNLVVDELGLAERDAENIVDKHFEVNKP